MIHLENWDRYHQGVLWVNLYLGLQSWKYLPNPPVDCLSNRLFRMYTLVMSNSVLSIAMLLVSSSWWGLSSTLLTVT